MAAGLLFVGTVVACCGLCAVWSVVSESGWREGLSSLKNNNERRHHRRSSFGCHVALSDVAPANPSPPFVPFCCDVAVVVLSVVVVGVGDRYRWRPLATVTMVVVVKQGGGGSEEAVGVINDGGGGG